MPLIAMWRKGLMLAALVILSLTVAGCLMLLIPSLGYEAYEYHKTGTLPGMPKQPQNSPTPRDDSIE
jgi:hypothetical protein